MSANEVTLHIPACARMGWDAVRPSPMRRLFIERDPDPVGAFFDTPLLPLLGKIPAMGVFRRTSLLARALLETIHEHSELKVCLIDGKYCEVVGETIVATGRDREDKQTLMATLDYGESPLNLLKRFAQMRAILKLRPQVALPLLRYGTNPELPPPQILLSNLSHLVEAPQMCLGGCAGAAPIAVAIGSKRSHVIVDHKLFDAPHYMAVINGLCENVERMGRKVCVESPE